MNEQAHNQQPNNQKVVSDKKSKNKIILIVVALILIGAGVYAGLSLTKKGDEVLGSSEQRQIVSDNPDTNRVSGRLTDRPQFQGVTTTAEDLSIGVQVFVSGTTNSDGSLTAETIRLGEFNDQEFQGFLNQGTNNETSNEDGAEIIDQNEQAPQRNSVRDFNRGEFQNLSPEERQRRLQELQESGQVPGEFGGGGRGQGAGSAGRAEGAEVIRGEIIDKEDISITVKLLDGGSRLVFYTEEVQVIRVGEVNRD